MSDNKRPETHKVGFLKSRPAIEVTAGANLMQALLAHEIPVASSCRGDGVCAKCRVRIVEGAKNLSPETEIEAMRRDQFDFARDERLSCQAEVLGNITIDTPYW